MIAEQFVNGRARSNTWLLERDGDAVVVDAGTGAARKVAEAVERRGLRLRALLLTHGHPDHTWTARALSGRFGVAAHLHPADWRWLDDPAGGGHVPLGVGRVLGAVRRLRPERLEPLAHGDRLRVGGFDVAVVHTPGHTPGSVCFVVDGSACFSGDTLFARSAGRSAFPGGSAGDLARSLRDRLLAMAPGMALHPGHGPPSTVGDAGRFVR